MRLSKLKLTNFKSYPSVEISFLNNITCFIGENGEGKTNLLDAIYYSCVGKSYFNTNEKMNIRHREQFLRIEAHFSDDLIELMYQPNTSKIIKRNKVKYQRIADYVGFSPVVMIAPDDNQIILEGSERRRKEINIALSQIDKNYLFHLIKYQKLLKQRNASLKLDSCSKSLLATYDQQMIPLAEFIHERRKLFVENLSIKLSNYYSLISRKKEHLTCTYQSQLNENSFQDLLQNSIENDLRLRRSNTGIHKDDLIFLLNDFPLKKFGSQGQQKTSLFALKLSIHQILLETNNHSPILLLDDIFDKLDRGRMYELFSYLIHHNIGQIFITDTNGERIHEILQNFDADFCIYEVKNKTIAIYENE